MADRMPAPLAVPTADGAAFLGVTAQVQHFAVRVRRHVGKAGDPTPGRQTAAPTQGRDGHRSSFNSSNAKTPASQRRGFPGSHSLITPARRHHVIETCYRSTIVRSPFTHGSGVVHPAGSPSVGYRQFPRQDVTVPVRRYETEDVTIPAAFVTIALPRYDPPFRPGPCTSLGDRRPHTGGGVCTHRGIDRRGPTGRRSKRGSTRSRELRRFNNCEQGKPDLALIHQNHPLGEADERRPRPR